MAAAGPSKEPGVRWDQAGADVAVLASLAEPIRRALYLYVHAQESAVSRDEAAAGMGVPRHKAKFHLDRLVEDGLLEVEFARRTGRQGPGAGRPAKLYRPAAREFSVSVPQRNYELAGQLMAETLQQAGDDASPGGLLAAARSVLDEQGYETRANGTFANCPFHALVPEHTDLVCGMNLAIIEGMLGGLRRLPLAAVLDPAEGRCCVRLAAGA